ncbi:S8 family serine peptidase [Candidatus Poriferisodalis sp.]|uniref:S8 family serine peptidase n=1 Tax=Candidatus Poriferisodalis sp. TaxID=3101277 RepID=UPI003AF9C52D
MRVALVVCVAAGTLALGVLAGDDALAQTPPAVPTITAVASGDTALTVAWTAPTGVTGIESYDLRWILTSASAADKADDGNWNVLDPAWESGDLHVIVTGLSNGARFDPVSYDVQVRAVTTSNGVTTEGAWSATSTGTPSEPGFNRARATAIVDGLPAHGVIGPDDDSDWDYFSFQVTGTREVVIWTTGDTDTSGQLFDSSGNINASNSGEVIASNNNVDFIGDNRNFRLSAKLQSGTYYIEVTGAYPSTAGTGPYTLHLQSEVDSTGIGNAVPTGLDSTTTSFFEDSRDTDYFKLELTAETAITAYVASFVLDTVGAILNSEGTVVATNDNAYLDPTPQYFALRETLPAGVHYIRVKSSGFPDSGWYHLRVAESPEPGSVKTSAAELRMGDAAGGTTDPDGDWFTFTLDESTRVALVGSSTEADITATLEDSTGTVLDVIDYETDISVGAQETVSVFAISHTLAAGAYHLKIEADPPTDTGGYIVLLRSDDRYERLLGKCPAAPSGIDDTLYGCQWHLDNTGQFDGTSGEDINIRDSVLGDVWDITKGAGVNVAVVDSGLDYLHEDLTDNVLLSGNHSYGSDLDLRIDPAAHGTAVAGIIAARDNSVGMRGVAPRATIYAHDLLNSFSLNNAADALSRNRAATSVSNNSWSPVPGPSARPQSSMVKQAIEAGLREGDGGKGIVYVFGTGNGGEQFDWASLDENLNHYGVTAVCSVDDYGNHVDHSEKGPNLWICAPSAGGSSNSGIATTLPFSRYRATFGGTSAATPMVSGVVALVRSVGPSLSWRDVKLILAASARRNDADDAGWEAGALKYGSATDSYSYNHQYGFGVVDASAAVALAGSWANVPEMRTAAASADTSTAIPSSGSSVSTTVDLDGEVDFVEFVEVNVDFNAPRFRDLKIELESPSGNISILTPALVTSSYDTVCYFRDTHICGLTGTFRFGSARHLGEDPRGTWTLRVADEVSGGSSNTVRSWDLKVYGHRPLAPGAVLLGFVRPGSGSLTVGWDEPLATGTFGVAGYEIRHIRSDAADKSDGEWELVSSSCVAGSCSAAITGLTDGVRRDVQVRAVSTPAGVWSFTVRGTPGAANGEPFFVDGERTTRGVDEHAGSGVAVGPAVAARDAEPDVFVYSLAGDDAGLFVIDASSGQLTTGEGFVSDFEGARNSFEVTVSVSDGKADDGTASTAVDDVIAVTVAVVNVDEPGGVSLSVSQPRAGDRVSAFLSDPDDPDRLIRGTKWRWERSAPGSMLGWARVTGVPQWGWRHSTYVPNDDDVGRFLRVTASYSDPQGPGKSAEVVSALLVRADNVAPVFPAAGTVARRVDESAGPNTEFGDPVVASDPDGDDLTYSLGGLDGASFGIVADSGQLVTKAALDFETELFYAVAVTATDPRGLTDAQQVIIWVNDVNEAPAFPTGVSDMATVVENSTATGLSFTVDDPEGDSIEWSLSGADRLVFDVFGGVLTFKDPPDFEMPADQGGDNTYNIDVVASDNRGRAGTLPVVVEVVNGDDPGRVRLSPRDPEVGAELRATLSDPDGSVSGAVWMWERSQSGSRSDWDVVGGAVSDSYTVVDDDLGRFLQVSVSYRDRHGPLNQQDSLKGASVVTDSAVVAASPVMNEAPVFPEDETGLREVSENTASGEAFGLPVAATDPGDLLTYTLSGRDGAVFDVVPGSGQLRTEAPLDHESRSSYVFTVTATDPSGESATKSVTVTVTDIDEPGGLQLEPTQPVAGKPLTATLVDPDELLTGPEWTWWRSGDSSGPGGWVQIDGAASLSYQPAAGNPDDGDPDGGGHEGLWLQVRVTYRDVHNPADSADPNVAPFAVKTLQAVTVNPVAPPNNNNGGNAGSSSGLGGGSSASGGNSSSGGGGGGGDFDVGVASFVVANGWSAADVGVASVLAARTSGAVVVYTAGDELSEETRLLLREALPAEVIIVGGNAAVSRDVRTQIRAASSESGISRVTGADRADTAAATARRILGTPAAAGRVTLVVANGWSPPDIGAAAALAARSGRSAVIYTEAARLPETSAALLRDYEVARVILVGGTAAISDDVRDAISAAAGGDASISRLTGDERIDTAAQTARRVLGSPAAAPDGVTLVIANGWSPPDVGVAAALAAATDNAAVAYTAQGALPEATAALIRDYRPGQVIIVGGRAAVANDVRAAITQTAPDSADIRRITGTTRTDTAARAARRILANP